MRQAQGRPDSTEQASVEWSLLEGSAIVATIVLSPDGRVVRSNARMRELLAVGAAERLSGRALAEFLAQPDDWSRWAAQRATDAGAVLRLRSASGATVALQGDVRKTSNGALCGVFVTANDDAQLRAAVQHSARMEALGSSRFQ
jgi:PAS domain-containing protein